jgi:hypothetical protein
MPATRLGMAVDINSALIVSTPRGILGQQLSPHKILSSNIINLIIYDINKLNIVKLDYYIEDHAQIGLDR